MYGVQASGERADVATRQRQSRIRVRPETTTAAQRRAVRDLAMLNLSKAGWPVERIAVAVGLTKRQAINRLAEIRQAAKRLAS